MMKLGAYAAILLACLSITAHAADQAPTGSLIPLMPDSYGFYNLKFKIDVAGKPLELPCRLFVPRGYDAGKGVCPALIFLHTDDDRGTDLVAIAKTGPELKLRQDQSFRDNFKFITVCPQCPSQMTWDDPRMAGAVLALIDELGRNFRIDPERVCLSGTGMGAAGACRVAMLAPERFAALAINSPVAVATPEMGAKLKHIASWITGSPNDKINFPAYLNLVESLGNAHADVQFAQMGNSRLESNQQFFGSNQTYDWLAGKHRRSAQERQARDAKDAQLLHDELAKIPTAPGDYKLQFETWVGDKKQTIPYEISLPRGYVPAGPLWPVVMFLHGAGEPNLDGGQYVHGPLAQKHSDATFSDWCPFIILSPIHDNSPERATAMVRLVDTLPVRFRADPDRVYVTGLSLGGTSTWTVAEAGPDRFAAIAPISGRVYRADQAGDLLKYVSTWIICGGDDGDFTDGAHKMYASLTKAGCDVHMTIIPSEGHGSWPRYFQDRRFYDWMLTHRRLTAAQRAERDKVHTTDQTAAIPLEPGTYWRDFPVMLRGKPAIVPCAVYLPHNITGGGKLPLMLFLHRDDDRSTDLPLVFDWGADTDPRRDPTQRNAFPMIGVSPICPNDKQWTDADLTGAVLSIMDDLSKRLPVDQDRVYATGMQMGGAGTWQIAMTAPDRFAAIAPFRTGAPDLNQAAAKLKYLAVRLIAPVTDGGAVQGARQMVDALRKSRMEVRLSLLPASLDRPTFEPYELDPDLCSWFLAHRRLSPQDHKERDDRLARAAAVKPPQDPGDHLLTFETRLSGGPMTLSYRIYLPKGFDKTQERVPMMLFLHGDAPGAHDPAGAWGPDLDLVKTPKLGDGNPLVFLCPQCPPGRRWDEPNMETALVELVDDVTWRFRVDPNRVYATGVDVGGLSAFRTAMEAPDRFAAIAPVASGSAGAIPPNQAADALRGVAMWIVAGPNDAPAADLGRQTVEAMKKAQTDAQETLLTDGSLAGVQQLYADPKFYAWLLAHHRPG